ncbi:MAG: AAA family ATPase, partial [Candidatus Theseobacter exili]|nr:AAA family ATPase [Candidatus Theseobacter exili]
LEKILVAEDLKKLVEVNLKYRLGRIGTKEYVEFLKETAERDGTDFFVKYPQMQVWYQIESMNGSMESGKIWRKLDAQLLKVMNNEALKSGTQEILSVYEEWALLNDLFALKLSRDQLDSVKQITFVDFTKRFQSLCDKYQITAVTELQNFEPLFNESMRFYDLALMRDKVLAEKSFDQLSEKDQSFGILITGGFHTEGIEQILREKGVSFITLAPKINKLGSDQIYEKRMMSVDYDFAGIEFSEKRFAVRKKSSEKTWTLASAALWGNIFKGIAEGEYAEENSGILAGYIEGISIETLNEHLNKWMQEGSNREFLDSIDRESIGRLVHILSDVYPDAISGQIAEINRQDPTQRQVTLGVFRSTYGKDYPGLVALVELYFSKAELKVEDKVELFEKPKGDHGLISQGEESKAIFRYRLSQGEYENSRREDLEEQFAEHLNGQKVYVIPSIVKSSKDFLLGYRDIENGIIYVSQQVVDALKDNPDALAEYLFHEVHCEGKNHEEVIALQQKRFFKANYEGRGYDFDKEKGHWVDPANGKIAKGILKDVLRGQIEAVFEPDDEDLELGFLSEEYEEPDPIESGEYLYESVDEALAVYRQEHGEPDPVLMKFMEERIYRYEWFVKTFGLNDLLQLGVASGKDAGELFEHGLNALERFFFSKKLRVYWPELVQIGIAAGEDVHVFMYGLPVLYTAKGLITDNVSLQKVGKDLLRLSVAAEGNTYGLFSNGLSPVIKLFGEKFTEYWPVLVQLGLDFPGNKAATLFKDGLVGMSDLIVDVESLQKVGNELIEIAAATENWSTAGTLFELIPEIADFYGGDQRKTLKVLRDIIENEDAALVFIELFKDKDLIKTKIDLVKRRLAKIASADSSVDKAGDLRDLIQTLKKLSSLPEDEEDPFSRHGLISQGEESKAIFRYRLSKGKYDKNRRKDLETKFAEHLNGQKVYVIPSIVKSSKDFLLGYRDIENGRIYVAQEVVDKFKDNPDALAEYLFHEAHCNGDNHYDLITEQQNRFRRNYLYRGYKRRIAWGSIWQRFKDLIFLRRKFDSSLFKGLTHLTYPALMGKAAKGVLGEALRNTITEVSEGWRFKYPSVDEALRDYERQYGEVSPLTWYVIKNTLVNYEKWIKAYGVKSFVDIYEPVLGEKELPRGIAPFVRRFNNPKEQLFSSIIIFNIPSRGVKVVDNGLYKFDLNEVRNIITDTESLERIGSKIIGLAKEFHGKSWVLNLGLIYVSDLIDTEEDFDKILDEIIRMDNVSGGDAQDIFIDGLVYLEPRVEPYWKGVLELTEAFKNNTGNIFAMVISGLSRRYKEYFLTCWPAFVKLLIAGSSLSAHTLSYDYFQVLEKLFDGERNTARFLSDMFEETQNDDNVADGIAEEMSAIMQWFMHDKTRMERFGDFVERRFKKTATNSDPLVRMNDLRELAGDLDKLEYVESAFPYTRAVPSGISQGERAPAEFRANLNSGFYDEEINRDMFLEGKVVSFIETSLPNLAEIRYSKWSGGSLEFDQTQYNRDRKLGALLKDYNIRVIPSGVYSSTDFSLGYHDVENRTIYLTDKVVDRLLRGPPALMKEYLWHELNEKPSAGVYYHYNLIMRQQNMFPENYEGKNNATRLNVVGIYRYFVNLIMLRGPIFPGWTCFIDTEKGKRLAKGALGENLRAVIDEELVTNRVWGEDRQNLKPYMADFVEIQKASGENSRQVLYSLALIKDTYPDIFEELMPTLVVLSQKFGNLTPAFFEFVINQIPFMIKSQSDLRKIGSDIGRLLESISMHMDEQKTVLLIEAVPSLVDLFGENLGTYWNDIIEMCEESGANAADLILSLSALKEAYGDDFLKYWPVFKDLVIRAKNAYPPSFIKDGLPAVRELVEDDDSLRDAGDDLIRMFGDVASGDATKLYTDGIATVKSAFGANWTEYWPDLVEMALQSSGGPVDLLSEGILKLKSVFGTRLSKYWPDLVKISAASGSYINAVFLACPELLQTYGNDFFKNWDDFVQIATACSEEEVVWLFHSGFAEKFLIEDKDYTEYSDYSDPWPRIKQIGIEAGSRAGTVLGCIIPGLFKWSKDFSVVERTWRPVLEKVQELSVDDEFIPEHFLELMEKFSPYIKDEKMLVEVALQLLEIDKNGVNPFSFGKGLEYFFRIFGNNSIVNLPLITLMSYRSDWALKQDNFLSHNLPKFVALLGDETYDEKAVRSSRFFANMFSEEKTKEDQIEIADSLFDLIDALRKKGFHLSDNQNKEVIRRLLMKTSQASEEVNKAEELKDITRRILSDSLTVTDEIPYAAVTAGVQPHGFVAKGDISRRLWHLLVILAGQTIDRDLSKINEDYKDVLEGHQIVLFKGIAVDEEDYFLATRTEIPGDPVKKVIYIAEEVLDELKDSPDLLRELIWHEVHCTGENHTEMIKVQQRMFRDQNYTKSTYKENDEGLLVDPDNDYKLAKGDLGDALRRVINRIAENTRNELAIEGKSADDYVEEMAVPGIDVTVLKEYKDKIKEVVDVNRIGGSSKQKIAELEEIERELVEQFTDQGAVEEDLKKLVNALKLEVLKELVSPYTRMVNGRPFFFISLADNEYKEIMILHTLIEGDLLDLSREDQDLLSFITYSRRLEATVRRTKWREVFDIANNFFIRDDPEILEYFELVDNTSFYKTMQLWYENLKLKRGDHDALRVMVELGGLIPDMYLETAYIAFLERVINNDQNLELTEGKLENVKSIFTMFASGAGAAQTNHILGRMDEISSHFDNATNDDILLSLSEIAKGAGKNLNSFIDTLLNTDKYKRLFQRDIKRFQMLGVILSHTGPEGFEAIDFSSIYDRYGIEEKSLEEIEMLKSIGKLSALTGPETGDFLKEILDLYGDDTRDITDLNKLLNAQVYFVRLVNFHRDFEAYVENGVIGKVNNETLYVSLRDMKKSLTMLKTEFESGQPMRVAVRRAVARRYCNRLGKEDREEVVRLMRKHHLISDEEDLDYLYSLEGVDEGSDSIKLYEQTPPKIVQTKTEVIEEKPGEKQLLMDISLDRPFEGLTEGEVLNSSTMRNLGRILQALGSKLSEKINPVMLFGITAGGKSTVARIAAKILGMGYTRIQVTEQTDEFELFGSFQPHEIKMDFMDAVDRLKEGLTTGEYSKLEEAFSRVKFNEEGRLFDSIISKEQKVEYDKFKGEKRLAYRRWVIENWINNTLEDYLNQAEQLSKAEKMIERKIERGETLTLEEISMKSKISLMKTLGILMDNEIGLRFVEGRFLEAYKRGDMILLDEVNLANEEMLGVLYQMLTLGYLEHNGKIIKPDGIMPKVIATANPSSYSGRNRMSEAFMNRFEIINVDDMTPKETADILSKQLEEEGIDIEDDLGFKKKDLIQLAETQRYLNNLLRTGKFSNMGQEQDYVFTFRDLKRIVDDIVERKKAGLDVSFETWIQEAFLQYRGVLVRQEVYDSEDTDNEDYKRIRNAFTLNLGFTEGDLSQEETFDNVIKKRFGNIDYEYDEKTRTLRLDGIETPGQEPDEEVPVDELVVVESMKIAQIQVAKALRRPDAPVLFVGQSGGGKTDMVADAVKRTGRKYVSVSLGDASLDSLIGSLEYDGKEKRFKYRPGILVKAMEEGDVLVLEELNMAKSGIIEILNEYFDDGTFTNPYTLKKVRVHENFRLFATMNPMEGTMGANEGRRALSPALRNRFREVWVPHEKTDKELRQIISKRFEQAGLEDIATEMKEKILSFYRGYKAVFSETYDEVYYTSLRDIMRIIKIVSRYTKDLGMSKDQALARAVHRVYGRRMTDQDSFAMYEEILGHESVQILKHVPGKLSYKRV